jgi:hypothetical protein
VPETLRLDRTFTCEGCWSTVKPFIEKQEHDADGVLVALHLRCPVDGCAREWRVRADELQAS